MLDCGQLQHGDVRCLAVHGDSGGQLGQVGLWVHHGQHHAERDCGVQHGLFAGLCQLGLDDGVCDLWLVWFVQHVDVRGEPVRCDSGGQLERGRQWFNHRHDGANFHSHLQPGICFRWPCDVLDGWHF